MRKVGIILALLSLVVLSGCYSCESWYAMRGKGPVKPGCEHKFFLSSECQLAEKAPPKPEPKPEPKPKKIIKSKCGAATAVGHYPGKTSSVVKLEKDMPAEVAKDSKFDYTIKVTNPTDYMLSEVVVTENLTDNFKLVKTNPKAETENGKLHFNIGKLNPGQTKVITISGTATTTDCLQTCAAVSYVIPTCANTKVVEPKLGLRKTSPSNVLLCEEIPTKFVVTNPGSGTVKDVKIEDKLPDGLKTIDGDSTIAIDAGTLAEGESKEFTVTLKADKTGKYENTATASSSRGLKAEASSVTQVRQPILEIDKTGPEKRYLGRSVTYEITVANKGDAPANDLVIRDRLPAGVKFLSASGNGTAENRRVQWSLGTVEPGDSRKVSVTVMPESAKTISNTAIVSAECAEGVRASARTQIEGIPAILLEVIDTQDPIEVGGRTTYVITATNQGTAPATNIQIICGLEEEMSHISSSGVTRSSAEGSKVTFQPLGSLAPGEKAEWRVNVRAVSAGDVRFKVDMNTDQLSRPVEETEATHLYE